LILNKIRYYGLSQQTQHIRDVASILIIISGDEIDWEHLNTWIGLLGLTPIWQELKAEIDDLLARQRDDAT
jgi:hypothetical protein